MTEEERKDKFIQAAMIAVMAAEDANYAKFMTSPEVYEAAVKQVAKIGLKISDEMQPRYRLGP